ncbi:MAG: hypothetical protein IPM54_18225 [Polyangiaceae bacterium]|nr:hypothetical protein [Polyangiaceae bacterium]
MQTVVEIQFDAADISGGADAILGPSQCEKEVVKIAHYKILGRIDVTLQLDNNDARVPKLLALLADAGAKAWINRNDIYTEDELQAARLLFVSNWIDASAWGGPRFGTTYDMSQACPTCATGARQTSPLIVGDIELRTVEKHRVASTNHADLLIRDTDVERLIAANITGAVFWPASVKRKSGEISELRWQQAVIEHVMPPMAASSYLDRKGVCPTCHRGGFTGVSDQPLRITYRAEDLANIHDFNRTWEWLGEYGTTEEEVQQGRWSHPGVLVTPKVMNLLRAKTKKEAKYQGCDFIPVWLEDEKHEQPYLQT